MAHSRHKDLSLADVGGVDVVHFRSVRRGVSSLDDGVGRVGGDSVRSRSLEVGDEGCGVAGAEQSLRREISLSSLRRLPHKTHSEVDVSDGVVRSRVERSRIASSPKGELVGSVADSKQRQPVPKTECGQHCAHAGSVAIASPVNSTASEASKARLPLR